LAPLLHGEALFSVVDDAIVKLLLVLGRVHNSQRDEVLTSLKGRFLIISSQEETASAAVTYVGHFFLITSEGRALAALAALTALVGRRPLRLICLWLCKELHGANGAFEPKEVVAAHGRYTSTCKAYPLRPPS
jgi:hypothetical protein